MGYHEETGLAEGQYVTRSMLHLVMTSPFEFRRKWIDGERKSKTSDAMWLGQIVEALLTDERPPISTPPESPVVPSHLLTPSGKVTSKKELAEEATEWTDRINLHKEVLKEWDRHNLSQDRAAPMIDKAKTMIHYAMKDASFVEHFNTIEKTKEVIRWEEAGVNLQVEIDAEGRHLYDFKTGAASPQAFQKSALKYGYTLQQFMYSRHQEKPFTFLYLQSEYPNEPRVIHIPHEQTDKMEGYFQEALRRIRMFKENPDWIFKREDLVINLPQYAQKEFEQYEEEF